MCDIHTFTRIAHAIALDCLDEDHRRLTRVFYSGSIGSIDLVWIVTTPVQPLDVGIGDIGNHGFQFRVFAEEMLAHIGAVIRLVGLIFTIDHLLHTFIEMASRVSGNQRIPVRSPDHLDHIPTRAAEFGFQFLNDFTVASHGPIQPLQIAIDDENEIVELFPRRQRDRATGFWFIHFTVTHKGPDFASPIISDFTVFQITHEAGLINGHDRPKPHGNGREMPVIRHQPRVGIRGQAPAIDILPEVV